MNVKRFVMCMKSSASSSAPGSNTFEWIITGETVVRASDYDSLREQLRLAQERIEALEDDRDERAYRE